MVAVRLEFSICKKLVNKKIRDMTQLVEKVRRIEQIKYEKKRIGNSIRIEGENIICRSIQS